MENENQLVIENARLKVSIDLTKSVIKDVIDYIKNFDCEEALSPGEKVERYKQLVDVLRETTNAFNDDYVQMISNDYAPAEKGIQSWEPPSEPKEKAAYVKLNMPIFFQRYKLYLKAKEDEKNGIKTKGITFEKSELTRFIKDLKELKNISETLMSKYKNEFSSFFLTKLSLQEYADQHFDGIKRKAQYLSDTMVAELEKAYKLINSKNVRVASESKLSKKSIIMCKLYSDAENNAFEKSIKGGNYYDHYKEEMEKVEELLQLEEKSNHSGVIFKYEKIKIFCSDNFNRIS